MNMNSSNQVAAIRSDLKKILDDDDKNFYIESIAESGIGDIENLTTQDMDKLLQFFASTEASTEYQANVFAAIESHLPNYLVAYIANSDRDNDGVTFASELQLGTNPSIADSPARKYSQTQFAGVNRAADELEL